MYEKKHTPKSAEIVQRNLLEFFLLSEIVCVGFFVSSCLLWQTCSLFASFSLITIPICYCKNIHNIPFMSLRGEFSIILAANPNIKYICTRSTSICFFRKTLPTRTAVQFELSNENFDIWQQPYHLNSQHKFYDIDFQLATQIYCKHLHDYQISKAYLYR